MRKETAAAFAQAATLATALQKVTFAGQWETAAAKLYAACVEIETAAGKRNRAATVAGLDRLQSACLALSIETGNAGFGRLAGHAGFLALMLLPTKRKGFGNG